jgi:hypothetical protein
MADIANQSVNWEGVKLTTTAAAAAGDTITGVDTRSALIFFNASAGVITVTIAATGYDKYGELTIHNNDVAIPAGEDWAVGGDFFAKNFADSSGECTLTYSTHTDLSILPLKTAFK